MTNKEIWDLYEQKELQRLKDIEMILTTIESFFWNPWRNWIQNRRVELYEELRNWRKNEEPST